MAVDENRPDRTKIKEPAPELRRGYVISEDADLALRDIANGLDAVAFLCEEREGDMPEIPAELWAGLLRTFSRQAMAIASAAAFALDDVRARPRDLH